MLIRRQLVIARTGDIEYAPQNTLSAFESAITRGADGVELDVHASADGELVVHHSHNLGITDNGAGLVSEHSLADLRTLDAGSWFDAKFAGKWIPTLGEVFELCKRRIRLEVDLKGSGLDFLRKVVREVERFDLINDVELTTAHYPLLMHVRRLNSHLQMGTFFYQPPEWMPIRLAQQHTLDWAEQLEINVIHLNSSLISAEYVQTLHRRGFVVYGSNLDSADEVRKGLELGIDSLSTGHLGMALRVRDEFAASLS